jgi:hypothetical protein
MSTVKKYLVAASLGGAPIAAFSLESLGDVEKACDRFLDWFLVRRSAWFDLSLEDVEAIKESKVKCSEINNSDAEHQYTVNIKDQQLTVAFFPVKFII